MRDPFGIEKSFVPGKGYKAAKELLPNERKLVRAKAEGKTIKLTTKSGQTKLVRRQPNRMANAGSAKGRQIWPGVQTKRGKLTKVVASRNQTGLREGANSKVEGFSQPDGRGGGHVVIHDDAAFGITHKHEMAHIKPRRNPVHFQSRVQNPFKLGKEEGRADFVAHQRATPGQYPGNADFQAGYNKVQSKMTDAQHRKKFKKSFTRMAPKLAGALKATDPAKTTSLTGKLRHHAGVERLEAGRIGQGGKLLSSGFMRTEAKQGRVRSRMLNTGAMNANRKSRYLP